MLGSVDVQLNSWKIKKALDYYEALELFKDDTFTMNVAQTFV